MNTKDINKYILEIKYNNETQKYFWEIWVNGNITLKSDKEYEREYDCKIHLISLCNAFRYIDVNKQITL